MSKMTREMRKGVNHAKYHKDYETMRRLQRDIRTLELRMKQYKPKGK